MEVINYTKTLCILNTFIIVKLKEIFKQRWYIESNSEWKSNPAHSIYLKKLHPSYDSFSLTEQIIIEKGDLSEFTTLILCSCLLNIKFKNASIEKNFINQNNNITKINDINIKVLRISNFQISNNQFKEYKKILLDCIFQFSDELLIDFIKQDVEFILETLQCSDKGFNGAVFKINQENERLSESQKEKGIDLYKKGELFEAYLSFGRVSKEGLSNKIKSILHLNQSTCQQEIRIDLENISRISEMANYDYLTIKDAKKKGILAAIYRPSWYKPYYKLGKITSRLSDYKSSIQFLDAAILLANQDPSLSESLKVPILNCRASSVDKLNLITKCINVISKKGKITAKRNYDKEARESIIQSGDLIKKNFQHLKLTEQFINKEGLIKSKNHPQEFNNFSKISGLPIKQFIENDVLVASLILFNKNTNENDKKASDYLSRCIGNGTDICLAYHLLGEMISFSRSDIKYDEALILSLYLYGSLLPNSFRLKSEIPGKEFKEINEILKNNECVSIIQSKLGFIYRFGLYGQDIDLEKSIYYFEKSIKNPVSPQNFNYEKIGKSYTVLGTMYWTGDVPDGKANPEKAKEIWTLGSNLGEEYCKQLLIEKFKNRIPLQGKGDEFFNQIKNENDFFGYLLSLKNRINKEEKTFIIEVLDFNEIKNQLVKNNDSFISTIYSTHMSLVLFMKKFNQYLLDKNDKSIVITNESKFNMIEILANAYRNFDAFFVVRIPLNKQDALLELINHLLEIDRSNVNVRICWLGLKRFSETQYPDLLHFVEESIDLYKKEDFKISYPFFNYQLINSHYYDENNKELAYTLILNEFKKINNEHLLYLSCKSIALFGFQENIGEIIDLNKFIISLKYGSMHLGRSLPKDHPYIPEINYYLILILIRLFFIFKDKEDIKHVYYFILEFYKIGNNSKDLIPKFLKSRSITILNLASVVVMSINFIRNLLMQMYPEKQDPQTSS